MTMASIIWMTIVLVCMIKQTECKNDQVYYFEPNPGAMWSREKMLEFFSLIDLTKKYVSTETGPGYEVYKNLMLISDKDEHDTKHLNGLSVAELIELNHWNAEKWTEEEIKRREAICKSFISESELLKEELDDDGNRCIKRNLGYYCWSIIQKITYQVKTHKLYDVELKNDITHKQLVMGLRKMRNLGTDQEDRNEFVKNVYKLLARTLNKDEPIQELGGVSVNKLLQLNTWNLLEWTKEEFDRRESVCSELFPVKAIAVRGTNYAILNMSSACQLINQDVFYRVRSDFSDRAAAELAQYGDKLREYFKKTGYDVRRNLTTLNERTKEQEEIIGICKNVVQRFTLSVDPSSLWPSMSDEARRTWDQHYKDCRAVLYS